MSYDRKAFSAEPAAVAAIMGKRWEDLIDAAASATEEDSRDLTPVSSLTCPSKSQRLTRIGTTIASPFAAHDESDVTTTTVRFTAPVVRGITAAERADSPTTGNVRFAAFPLGGIVH